MSENANWQERAKHKEPFKVPDGYFESLESRVLEAIRLEKDEEKRRVLRPLVVRWVSGVAAVLLIGIIGFQQLHLKPQKIQMQEEEAMYTVIEFLAQDLDDASFAVLMAENDLLIEEESTNDDEFLDYMDVNELEIIDAIIEGY